MSYDGWVEIDGEEVAEIGNHTSNTSRMWTWALSLVLETPTHLSDLDGWPCEKAAPVLRKAWDAMMANEGRLAQWNPPNGWGDFDSAALYLGRAAAVTMGYDRTPGAVIRWDV